MQVSSATETVYLGSDYLSSLGNALEFSSSMWTNLASGSVLLVDRQATTIKTGSVVTSGASGEQTVRVELTQSDLAALGLGSHLLRVLVTFSTLRYTLVDLVLIVK